ncbi:S-layer homology domain-containing protein [Candidatus Obscuribacterales bacterium]|nr:S-layer homology domain-containing protein [Candidatus Obscuribacterales bacterium]
MFAKILIIILVCLFSAPPAFSAQFIDLEGDWSKDAVSKLRFRNVIAPSADDKFNPAGQLTRSQLAEWLAKELKIEAPTEKRNFEDVKSDDERIGAILATADYFELEDEKKFEPDKTVTRGQLFCILAKALDPKSEPDEKQIAKELANFADGFIVPDWAKCSLVTLCAAKVFEVASGDHLVRAGDGATRGEAAVLLENFDYAKRKQLVSDAEKEAERKEKELALAAEKKQTKAGALEDDEDDPEVISTEDTRKYVVFPRGTRFVITISEGLNSTKDKRGEPRQGSIKEDVLSTNSGFVISPGSVFNGNLTSVVSAKRFFGSPGRVTLRFNELKLHGQREGIKTWASVDTKRTRLVGGARGERSAAMMRNAKKGAGIGFLVGSVLAPAVATAVNIASPYGGGALAGIATQVAAAGVGAVIGAGVTKGQELMIEPDAQMEILLERPMRIPMDKEDEENQPVFDEE